MVKSTSTEDRFIKTLGYMAVAAAPVNYIKRGFQDLYQATRHLATAYVFNSASGNPNHLASSLPTEIAVRLHDHFGSDFLVTTPREYVDEITKECKLANSYLVQGPKKVIDFVGRFLPGFIKETAETTGKTNQFSLWGINWACNGGMSESHYHAQMYNHYKRDGLENIGIGAALIVIGYLAAKALGKAYGGPSQEPVKKTRQPDDVKAKLVKLKKRRIEVLKKRLELINRMQLQRYKMACVAYPA